MLECHEIHDGTFGMTETWDILGSGDTARRKFHGLQNGMTNWWKSCSPRPWTYTMKAPSSHKLPQGKLVPLVKYHGIIIQISILQYLLSRTWGTIELTSVSDALSSVSLLLPQIFEGGSSYWLIQMTPMVSDLAFSASINTVESMATKCIQIWRIEIIQGCGFRVMSVALIQPIFQQIFQPHIDFRRQVTNSSWKIVMGSASKPRVNTARRLGDFLGEFLGGWTIWVNFITTSRIDRTLEMTFFFREIIPKWANYSG